MSQTQNLNQRQVPQTSKPVTHVEKTERRPVSVTIKKPLDEVYAIVCKQKNWPLFFENLGKTEEVPGNGLAWHLVGPRKSVSEKKNDTIQWISEDEAGSKCHILVQLTRATGNRGTVVRMLMTYQIRESGVSGFFEKLFGPDVTVSTKKNLQRFKAYCETGHFPTTDGQPSGREEDLNETSQLPMILTR